MADLKQLGEAVRALMGGLTTKQAMENLNRNISIMKLCRFAQDNEDILREDYTRQLEGVKLLNNGLR